MVSPATLEEHTDAASRTATAESVAAELELGARRFPATAEFDASFSAPVLSLMVSPAMHEEQADVSSAASCSATAAELELGRDRDCSATDVSTPTTAGAASGVHCFDFIGRHDRNNKTNN